MLWIRSEKERVKTRSLKIEGCGTPIRPGARSMLHPPVVRGQFPFKN